MGQPQRRSVLVLATDGRPSGCGANQNVDAVAARVALVFGCATVVIK